MPFVKAKFSCPVSAEQERMLKSRFGKAIALIPGKSEDYFFLELESGCRIWLHGSDSEPAAYLEAAVYGVDDHAGYPEFAAEAARSCEQVLGIPLRNVFVKFEDISSCDVGGHFFDHTKTENCGR